MIKAIVFDWGNVIGFYDNAAQNRMMSKRFRVSQKLFATIEKQARIKHDLGKLSTAEFVRDVGKGIGRKIGVKQYYTLRDRTAKPNTALIRTIRKLKGRYALFLLSNNSPPVNAEIRKYRLSKLFDKTLFSYQVGMKKPDPRFFRLLLKGTRLAFKDCLFVDDREDTCEVARTLGMKVIVFKDNARLKKEMAKLSIKA